MVSGKQRHLYTALVLLLLFVGQASAFAGGNGTASNPYEISNVDQLQNMSSDLDAHYELVSDINASETRNWNDGKGFDPIGGTFSGTLDGQGYVVEDMFIERDFGEVGFISFLGSAGVVKNIGNKDVNITSVDYTHIGGLIAKNKGGIVSNSYTTGEVSGLPNGERVGGLIGTDAGSVSNSYSTATVDGDSLVGGLIGLKDGGSVSKSYSTGSVSGNNDVGGFIGYLLSGSVTDDYWDTESSGTSSGFGTGSGDLTGLTTSEMVYPNAVGNLTGFDFSDTWATASGENGGYPFQQVFCVAAFSCDAPVIQSVEIEINESTESNLISLAFSSNGEQDISSFQGVGSVSTFTNSSLEANISFPFSASISVKDFTGLSSQTRSVDLDRNDSGLRQDPESASLSQQHLNQTYTLSNEGIDPVDYRLDLEVPGTLDSQEKWSGTLSGGSSTTHTVESHGDWIEEELNKFEAPEEVTLGKAFTASPVLEVVEQASVSWDNVSVSETVTSPSGCSQNNVTQISVPAGQTVNKTIGFSCNSGSAGTPTDSLYDHGSYEKAWYNTTLTVASNLTENSSIKWQVNKSKLPSYSGAKPSSLKASINGKSEDVTVVEGSQFIEVTVQDDFGNSSLHDGQHQASLTYTIPNEEPETKNESEYSITFSEEQYNTVIPGKTSTIIFTAFNHEPEPNQLYLETRDTKACQYFSIQTSYTGDEYGEESSLRLPASTRSGTNSTGDVVLKAKVDVPNRTTLLEEGLGETFTCRFETGAGIGEADSLNLTVKSVDTTPRWVEGVRELVPDLPDTSLIYSTEICLPSSSADVSRLEQVQKYLEEEECGGDLYSIPLPTGEALAVIIGGFVLVYGVTKFKG